MNKTTNHQICHKVHITHHAMQRLRERVGNYAGYRDWNELASIARYKGRNVAHMSKAEYSWCTENLHKLSASSQVRMLNGFAYIFKGNGGKAQTLITVIRAAV